MRHVYGADGNVAATIDSSGAVTIGSEPSAVVGLLRGETDVFAGEAGAEWLGRIGADGRVFDAQYQFVGAVDVNGRITDSTGRTVGSTGHAADGAVLLLLVGALVPGLLAPPPPPQSATSTIMDEVAALAEENAMPGVRKNYKPLTDDDVFGTPHHKS
jgi:hypothetical protein